MTTTTIVNPTTTFVQQGTQSFHHGTDSRRTDLQQCVSACAQDQYCHFNGIVSRIIRPIQQHSQQL